MERGAIPGSGDDIPAVADSVFREDDLGRTHLLVAIEQRSLHGPIYRRGPSGWHIPDGSGVGYALALGHLSRKRVVSSAARRFDTAHPAAGISRKAVLSVGTCLCVGEEPAGFGYARFGRASLDRETETTPARPDIRRTNKQPQ